MSGLLPACSLSLLFILLFLFFTSMAAHFDNSQNYPNCPSYNCGHITINYPFWKIADADQPTTQFCGYKGFGINCTNNGTHYVPSIHLGSDSYYVKNITDSSIVLIGYDVSPAATAPRDCPRVRHIIDLETLLFNFSMGSVNLSFHFNCNGVPDFASPIPCLDQPPKKSCVNRMNHESEIYDWNALSCEDEAVTTVFDWYLPGISPLGTESLGAVRGGFELNWQREANCSKCETSNGRCGYDYNTTVVMCFCDDGITTTDHCKKGTFVMTSITIKFGLDLYLNFDKSILYIHLLYPINSFPHLLGLSLNWGVWKSGILTP